MTDVQRFAITKTSRWRPCRSLQLRCVHAHWHQCVCPFWPLCGQTDNMSTAPPLLMRSDSARGDFSPLKHFVVAKKKIGDVFEQLLNYVQETSQFVAGELFFFNCKQNVLFLSCKITSYNIKLGSCYIRRICLLWQQNDKVRLAVRKAYKVQVQSVYIIKN